MTTQRGVPGTGTDVPGSNGATGVPPAVAAEAQSAAFEARAA